MNLRLYKTWILLSLFLPGYLCASITVQEKNAAAFSQGAFEGTISYSDRVYPANNWTGLNGNIGPLTGARAAFAGKAVLFGGRSSTSSMTLNDRTYAFNPDSGSWDELSVSSSPSVRVSFAMDGDGNEKILLFGGYDGQSVFSDTWLFAGDDWEEVACSTNPSSRMGAAAARLSADEFLVFGGRHGPSFYSDTWIFNSSASSWTLLNPPLSPSARSNHAMAYAGEGKVLLYGGESGGYLKDCWIYDGNSASWTEIDVSASNPGQRSAPAMTYDSGIERVLLFGGETETLGIYSYNKALWMFNPDSQLWTQISSQNIDSERPNGRRQHIFRHIPGYGNILFGGDTEVTSSTNKRLFDDMKKYLIRSSGTYTTKIYDSGVSVNPVEYKSFWRYFGGVGDIKYQIATSSDSASLVYTGPAGEGSYYSASPLTPEAGRDGKRYFSVRLFLSCLPENVSGFNLSELNMKYNHIPEAPVLNSRFMSDGDSIYQSPNDRVWFYWFNAVDADNDHHMHSYELRLSTSPGFEIYTSSAGIPGQTDISYSHYRPDDFYPEGKYYWKVRATDDYGYGDFSDAWSFYVDTTPPAAVTDLRAEKILDSPGAVSLSWTATGNDGTIGDIIGGEIRVQWRKWMPMTVWVWGAAGYGEKIISTSVAAGERGSVLIDGLEDGTSYYFAVALKDDVITTHRNLGAISNNAFAWTQSPPEVSTISSPALYDILAGTVSLSYLLSDIDQPEDELRASVDMSTDSGNSWHTIAEELDEGTTFFLFNTLALPNSDFCIMKVRVFDRAGLSGEKLSEVFLIRNPNYPPFVEFTAPAENEELSGEVQVSWDISDGNPTDSHLGVLSISTDLLNWSVIAENIAEPYVSFNTMLFRDASYYLKIRVEDSPADSLTGEATVQVIIANGNTAPEDFSLISPPDRYVLNSATVTFAWAEANDPDGDAVHYILYYSTYPDFAQFESTETSQTGYSAGLVNLNDYHWKVKAVDFRGMEKESSEIFSFSIVRGSMTVVRTEPQNGAYAVNMTSVTFYFNNPIDAGSVSEITIMESSQAVTASQVEISGSNNNILTLRRTFSYPKDISVSIKAVKDSDENPVAGLTEFFWKNFMPANSFALIDFPDDNLSVEVSSDCFAQAAFVSVDRDYATGSAARENMEMSRSAKFTAAYGWRLEASDISGNSLTPLNAIRMTADYAVTGDFSRIRPGDIYPMEYVSGQWTPLVAGPSALSARHGGRSAAGSGGISFSASSSGPYALAAVKEAASLVPPLINKPNPFSASTEIWMDNPSGTAVTVEVFALTGEKVYERLYPAAAAAPAIWDGRDNAGYKLPDGMYYLSVTASGKKHGKLLGIVK